MANPQIVLRHLRRRYKRMPDTFVMWRTPLELVAATVLSAQCTDKRVNMVMPALFRKYRSARAYARAPVSEIRKIIASVTFPNSKARYLQGIGKRLLEAYGGKVPCTKAELLTLPGVSHKSANLVLAKAFGISSGVAVDTHVMRVAPRLGWTKEKKNPKKIERDLNALFDPKNYLDVNEFLIMHGRAVCKPKPLCSACPLNDICPSAVSQRPAKFRTT